MDHLQACPFCGKARVAVGRISGQTEGASFQFDDSRPFPWPFPASVGSAVPLHQALACIDCGHIWTQVEDARLRATIVQWGTKELKERLLDEK